MKTEDNLPNNVVPLRTVLQNFLNLVETYEAKRSLGVDAYEKEFQELKLFSESLKNNPDYQCKEGEKSVSRKKNRYKDILPFDYTRVTLTSEDDTAGSDYINANFIKGASGSSAYIACQGPLAHTVNDFWKMVVECEVQVIVMACMEQESGKHKCENYWVEEEDVEKQFGNVTVWLKKCRNVCPDFLVRTMRIRFKNIKGETEERNVCQFHYSAWPDHGIPNRVRPLLDMVRLIRDCQTSETLPVLVHCSAGCGRTGTICAIDFVWGLLRLGKLTADFSLFQLVKDMRKQRIAMVQTKDQYVLVHRAVKELFQEQLKIIDAHIYANLDQNGFPFDMKRDLEEPTYETLEFDKSLQNGKASPLNTERPIDTNNMRLLSTEGVCLPKDSKYSDLDVKMERSDNPSVNNYNGSLRLKKNNNNMGNSLISSAEFSESDKSNNALIKDDYLYENEHINGEPAMASGSTTKSGGLLRKPSINKIKSFFERSPKEGKEKKQTKPLSRAKSDVSSSRFYTFTSSFGGNKRAASPSPGISNNKSIQLPSINNKEQVNESEKSTPVIRISGKPPISAKPILPIKRSKSLKIHPASQQQQQPDFLNSNKNQQVSRERSLSKSGSSSGSLGSGHISNSPIKVNVKQLEISKHQPISAVSSKPETQTIMTCFPSKIEAEINRNDTSSTIYSPSKKHSTILTDFNNKVPSNYVNIEFGRSRMGISRDSDDINIEKHSSQNKHKLGKKKYDTVTPRSLGMLASAGTGGDTNGTSLIRSQSHVWQQEKLQPIINRIHSDDNLNNKCCKPDQLNSTRDHDHTTVNNEDENDWKGGLRVMKVKPLQTGSVSIGNDTFNSETLSSVGANNSQSTSPILKPLARHRVPKTNPYTNFPFTKSSPLIKRSEEAAAKSNKVLDSPRFQVRTSQLGRMNNYSTSIGNSSESSSSNTGTPKNSLPATPTQSIDGLYSQALNPSNGYCNNNNSVVPKTNYPAKDVDNAPKSILKGSLSSSSESDDPCKFTKIKPNNTSSSPLLSSSNNNTILGSCNGSPFSTPRITTVRTPLGIRERRNSFRQAVWKEAQNDGQQYHSSLGQSPSPGTTTTGQYQTFPPPFTISCTNSLITHTPYTSASNELPIKRDYEPIWPDRRASPMHVSTTYVGSGADTANTVDNSKANSKITYEYNTKRNDDHQQHNNDRNLETLPNEGTSRNHCESTFQSKLEEIKALLEGLSSPMPSGTNNNAADSNTSDSITAPKESSLTQHKSLKSPSRSQYQLQQQQQDSGGLSCFSFRRSNSFESISDDFESAREEYQPLVSSRSPFTFFTDAQQRRDASKTTGFHTFNATATDTSDLDGGFESINKDRTLYRHDNSGAIDSTPIPPPRTKARKTSASNLKESVDTIDSCSSRPDPRRANLSIWSNSNPNVELESVQFHRSNLNTASPYYNDNDFGQQQRDNNTNNNIGSSSPKSISRAFGVFQAKAASVRSRFANWTDARERVGATNNKQFNGDNDNNTNSYDENGFSAPAALTVTRNKLGQSRTTKHQYL